MSYSIITEVACGGFAVHVSIDRILVTGRVWPHSNEVAYSVSQGGNPKARNLDTIIDMIRVADGEITKHWEERA